MLKDCEFLLGLHGQEPWPVEFCLYPVAHTAMLPFKRGSQRSTKKKDTHTQKKTNVIIILVKMLLKAESESDLETHVCGSSRLNAYSCLPEWIVVSPSSELSSSEKQGGQYSKHMYTIPEKNALRRHLKVISKNTGWGRQKRINAFYCHYLSVIYLCIER